MNPNRAPRWIRTAVDRLESNRTIDVALAPYDRAARILNRGRTGEVLRGEWIGHALHPLMTDVPIGCWMSSTVLDLVGGRRARRSSRRLLGIGILAALPTAASGMADFGAIDDGRSRRVAVVHGVGNAVALLAYLRSWRLRGSGRHVRGVAWALAGGSIVAVTGYLGGHLSFARSVGTGERWLDLDQHRGANGEHRDESERGTESPRPIVPIETRT